MVVRNVPQSADHDRHGFHNDWPACREDRLFGVLAPEPVWSRRLRFLLAAGVLAVSAGVTATSVASEPDDQQEGVVVPAPGASPPVGDGPGQGTGGDTALPYEVDPVLTGPEADPTAGVPDDAAPVEAAPLDDPDAGLALGDPNAPAEDDVPAVAPVPPAEPVPPAASEPPAPPSGRNDQPDPAEHAPAAQPEQRSHPKPAHRKRRAVRKNARTQSGGEHSQGERSQGELPTADSPPAPSTNAAIAPAPQRIRGRFHVVLPGESLWSIASAILEPDASPAAVALEVRRLWRLNRAVIGTGDPNLLRIGVRLRLR